MPSDPTPDPTAQAAEQRLWAWIADTHVTGYVESGGAFNMSTDLRCVLDALAQTRLQRDEAQVAMIKVIQLAEEREAALNASRAEGERLREALATDGCRAGFPPQDYFEPHRDCLNTGTEPKCPPCAARAALSPPPIAPAPGPQEAP